MKILLEKKNWLLSMLMLSMILTPVVLCDGGMPPLFLSPNKSSLNDFSLVHYRQSNYKDLNLKFVPRVHGSLRTEEYTQELDNLRLDLRITPSLRVNHDFVFNTNRFQTELRNSFNFRYVYMYDREVDSPHTNFYGNKSFDSSEDNRLNLDFVHLSTNHFYLSNKTFFELRPILNNQYEYQVEHGEDIRVYNNFNEADPPEQVNEQYVLDRDRKSTHSYNLKNTFEFLYGAGRVEKVTFPLTAIAYFEHLRSKQKLKREPTNTELTEFAHYMEEQTYRTSFDSRLKLIEDVERLEKYLLDHRFIDSIRPRQTLELSDFYEYLSIQPRSQGSRVGGGLAYSDNRSATHDSETQSWSSLEAPMGTFEGFPTDTLISLLENPNKA
ncbi:MAG: hypothetical protein HRT71_13225, partial [Flavobacteriales bacterium]|nr:hypothetical protein [Flavobacteriales bacterium]